MISNIKGVSFGSIHTSTLGLYLTRADIDAPAPKKYNVDVPGGQGVLDLTEYFGSVSYDNRNLILTFTLPLIGNELLSAYSQILNALNGKYFDRIILDDDADYHYKGRAVVRNLQKGKLSRVIVECDCLPFKFENTSTLLNLNIPMYQGGEYPLSSAFPDGYGDLNRDGIIDASDRSILSTLRGRSAFESEQCFYADLDMDGVVSAADYNYMSNYLTWAQQQGGTSNSERLKHYMTNVVSPAPLKRFCISRNYDFGNYPVPVTFRNSSGNITVWELRIDNVKQYSGSGEYTTRLSGTHDILLLVTGSREGTITASFNREAGF